MSAGVSASGALVVAVLAGLQSDDLAPLTVFDAPPVRSAMPYAVIEEPQLGAADAAGVAGRIGTLAITYRDAGERPVRLRSRVALVEELIELLPGALADGWRIGGLVLARSRLARTRDGWLARSEWTVRVFRVN